MYKVIVIAGIMSNIAIFKSKALKISYVRFSPQSEWNPYYVFTLASSKWPFWQLTR